MWHVDKGGGECWLGSSLKLLPLPSFPVFSPSAEILLVPTAADASKNLSYVILFCGDLLIRDVKLPREKCLGQQELCFRGALVLASSQKAVDNQI